jgi:hypothetical protein
MEGTAVTETPIVIEDPKLIAEPAASVEVWAKQLAPEQNEANVYAAYWQARSGFFSPAPKSAAAGIDVARSGSP